MRPLRALPANGEGFVRVQVDSSAVEDLRHGAAHRRMVLPIEGDAELSLDLERFSVNSPTSRLVVMQNGAPMDLPLPEVVMFRGKVAGERGSHVFFGVAESGSMNGYVTRASGERFVISHPAANAGRGDLSGITVRRDDGLGTPSDLVEPCGLHVTASEAQAVGSVAGGVMAPLLGAPRVAKIAVDADEQFLQLFNGNMAAAGAYVQLVIGAVSDIYVRDLDVRMVLEFTRIWTTGPTEFGADDLEGFFNWWYANDDPSPYNFVHLFSGRRDLGYGGIGYVADPCSGSAFAISGLLLGSFPTPVVSAHLQNWDVNVVAHEMGHNAGTFHTHDGYSPPIDQCGSSGIWARSETMSYCHITPGGMLNIDLGFSRRVRAVINSGDQSCLFYDCNNNNVADPTDIFSETSADANGNSVPDECEDCNNNGILDTVDITQGAADVDNNLIPDVCDDDCNGNGVPDEYESSSFLVPDVNANLIPDSCESDCDDNGQADFIQIAADPNGIKDLDRNGVLDTACQDCNGNGITDFIDMLRPGNLLVSDRSANTIREYHAASGVLVRVLAVGQVSEPRGVAFGSDRQLYVCSFGDDRIVRINLETAVATTFVSAGSGGLDGPTGATFGPNGNLYVTSNVNSSVMEYNGATGAFVRIFVSSGSGGLSGPFGLVFGPNGNLFVSSNNNRVLEYNGLTGASLGTFVATGAGGLNGPRDLLFLPDGRLLVASFATNSVLQYSVSGAPLGVWANQIAINSPWGMTRGPNGHVYVARSAPEIRILEFDDTTSLYQRSFVRGDGALSSPVGMAFRPASRLDCNANQVLDECDITSATSSDCNNNMVPDDCEMAELGADCNGNLVLDACECIAVDAPQAEPVVQTKNRYLSIVPPVSDCRSAIRVTLTNLPIPFASHQGEVRWVSVPAAFSDVGPGSFTAAHLSCVPTYRSWSGISQLHVYGADVVPTASYSIQAIHEGCNTVNEGDYTAAVNVATEGKWADIVAPFFPQVGQPNFLDISALVASFQELPGAAKAPRTDLYPNVPDQRVDFLDISSAVSAFVGGAYPFAGPVTCP